ncbi:MAG: hypothetical protein ACR2JU_12430 [Nocardioidaceae bacterium]
MDCLAPQFYRTVELPERSLVIAADVYVMQAISGCHTDPGGP